MHSEIAKNGSHNNPQPRKHCPCCGSYEMKFWKKIEGIGDQCDYWYCPNCAKYEPIKEIE